MKENVFQQEFCRQACETSFAAFDVMESGQASLAVVAANIHLRHVRCRGACGNGAVFTLTAIAAEVATVVVSAICFSAVEECLNQSRTTIFRVSLSRKASS